jgi:hypothetical protein
MVFVGEVVIIVVELLLLLLVVVVVVIVVAVAVTKYQMAHFSAVCFKSSLYYDNFRETGIIVNTVQCDN